MATTLSILILVGSRRKPSYTRALSHSVAQALASRGTEPQVWDPLFVDLPTADPEHHHAPERNPNPDVRKLVAEARAADGFVFASPIYHNSYSGVLKNAIDHLAIAQFQYKPVALISHGGNRTTQAVDQLRIVARGLLAVALPTQVCTAREDYSAREQECALENVDISRRVERLAAELVAFAIQLKQMRGEPS